MAENRRVSKETAGTLYTGMERIHIAAAIGDAMYGMKGIGASEQNAGSIKNVNPESGRTHN